VKGVSDCTEFDFNPDWNARFEGARGRMAVAVCEVEDSSRDEERGAVWIDVAESNGDLCLRLVGDECERHARESNDLDGLVKRLRRRAQRQSILATLIGREVAVYPESAPTARFEADHFRVRNDIGSK
jgi:hypothetical protein